MTLQHTVPSRLVNSMVFISTDSEFAVADSELQCRIRFSIK